MTTEKAARSAGYRLGLGLSGLAFGLGVAALAQTLAEPPTRPATQTVAEPRAVALTPSEMNWSRGGLAQPGMEQVNLVGDPAKPGRYTVRLKFPKGYRIAPHSHPDSREVTVLSGVYATGYGETFDSARLKILPVGSFYTEPANLAHFIEIEEDVMLQISGTGPSGRRFIDAGK